MCHRQKRCLKRLMRDGRGEEKASLSLPWSAGLRAASSQENSWSGIHAKGHLFVFRLVRPPSPSARPQNIIKGRQQTRRSIRLLPKQFSAPVLDSWCPPVRMTMQILSVPASQVPRGTKTEWKASTRQQDRCKAPSSLTSLAEPHEARSQGTSGTVPRCE
jgi:hypothetical protein